MAYLANPNWKGSDPIKALCTRDTFAGAVTSYSLYFSLYTFLPSLYSQLVVSISTLELSSIPFQIQQSTGKCTDMEENYRWSLSVVTFIWHEANTRYTGHHTVRMVITWHMNFHSQPTLAIWEFGQKYVSFLVSMDSFQSERYSPCPSQNLSGSSQNSRLEVTNEEWAPTIKSEWQTNKWSKSTWTKWSSESILLFAIDGQHGVTSRRGWFYLAWLLYWLWSNSHFARVEDGGNSFPDRTLVSMWLGWNGDLFLCCTLLVVHLQALKRPETTSWRSRRPSPCLSFFLFMWNKFHCWGSIWSIQERTKVTNGEGLSKNMNLVDGFYVAMSSDLASNKYVK